MTRRGHELLVELGGWSELHQGELTKVLAGAWSPAYRAFFELLKQGVDPAGVLNRGLWDRSAT
jgi:FAD/FMN-containing dehydrogenase